MDSAPPLGFQPHHRFDLFEPGNKTALVCLDVPEMQRLIIDQLADLGYKLHTGMFLEDSFLKLRAHAYDVVVASEHFDGSTLAEHPILAAMNQIPAAQRRRQLFVLIGSSLRTNDEMQAFSTGVDVVVSLADVMNLRPVIRRTLTRSLEFYGPLNEALAASSAAGPVAPKVALTAGV